MAKSGSNLVHGHPSHILRLTTCVKARKSFSIVLPCLVMVYHQTYLDCRSFSISEDLVEMILALTLNIAKQYSWMILWLMMMYHQTKFDRSVILSGQTFTEVENLHCDLDLEYSKAAFSQDTPAYEHALSNKVGCQKISSSEHIIVMISLCEPKLGYCDLDLEDSNPFFTHDTGLQWCITILGLVTLHLVQRLIRQHPN